MKLFVTGATGFIGSHFVNLAMSQHHEVVALRRSATSIPRIPIPNAPIWVESPLNAIPPSSLENVDCFVHFAATGVTTTPNWNELFQTNVLDSIQAWQTAYSAGVRHFVICGSCFEYGQSGEHYEFIPVDAPLLPTTPYSASKAAATIAAIAFANAHQCSVTVLRPFHVFGEGEDERRLWPSLRRAALEGMNFPMTKGEQIRDFVPVEVVVDCFLKESFIAKHGGVVFTIRNVGTGIPQLTSHFCERWWKRWNAETSILTGAIPYRTNEVMRYVPRIDNEEQIRVKENKSQHE